MPHASSSPSPHDVDVLTEAMGAAHLHRERSTRPSAIRQARSRFIRGTGRRKVGKKALEEATKSRKEIASGTAFVLPPSVALKHWSGPDPELDDVQRALEKDIFTDLTFMIHLFINHHCAVDGADSSRAHTSVRLHIARALERAMLDAEAHFLRRHNRRTNYRMHYHRRLIAGYAQLLDLWDVGGEKAWEQAETARLLIFAGHRVNLSEFRKRFGF